MYIFLFVYALKKLTSITTFTKRVRLLAPVGFITSIFLVGVLMGTLLVQQPQDIGPRASVDPYFTCSSADIAALQYACGVQGFSLDTCSCNPSLPTSVPTATQVVIQPTAVIEEKQIGGLSGRCTPGNSVCIDSVRYTCTNSMGAYSSLNCFYGCNGNICALPKSTATTQPSATKTEEPVQILRYTNTATGICEGKGGVREVAGCLSNTEMKYWCNDSGTSDVQLCDTGMCKNKECISMPTLTPTRTPTPAPIDEFLDAQPHFLAGSCRCKMTRNGEISSREYECKNQSICCGQANFDGSPYGKKICAGNLPYLLPPDAEIRPGLLLQTNPELVNYDPNITEKGCGPAIITNICIEAKKENCDINQIAKETKLDATGTKFENVLSTLNNDIGLHSEYLFAKNGMDGRAYPIEINQPLANISETYADDMRKQIDEHNILIVHIRTEDGTNHLAYMDKYTENNNFEGVDTYFHQGCQEVNYTGLAYTVSFNCQNATLVSVAVVEMP